MYNTGPRLPRVCTLQVLVLEKETRPGGNSAAANSGINVLAPEVGDSPAAFKADTLQSGSGRCREELVDLLVDKSPEALAFLEAEGVGGLSALAQTGGQSLPRTHSPPRGAPAVGAALMTALQRSMGQQANLQVRTGVRVVGLRQGEGRRSGAWCVDIEAAAGDAAGAGGSSGSGSRARSETWQEQLQAGAVVLATGGYVTSQELLQGFAPYAAGLGTTNGAFASGDGLLLGQQGGAAAVDLEWVQLNQTGIVRSSGEGAGSASSLTNVAREKLRALGAILLNAQGRRFVNELATRDRVAQAILAQPQWQAFLLLGSETAAAFGATTLEPYLSGKLMFRAETLQHLAAATGMPEAALAEEQSAYNAAAAGGGADGFGKAVFPARIDPAQPVVWARVAPVAHYCMGGLAIDSRARVLDGDGQPIPGLFAADEVAGGVHGRNLLVGNLLLECVVFGRIAGAEAAARVAELARAGAAAEERNDPPPEPSK